MSDSPDRLYANPRDTVTGFTFDENVAAVFPDMIQRSVPGYNTIIAMTGVIAATRAKPGTTVYDLGCSLGASTLSMATHINDASITIQAIDNSMAMLARCRQLVQQTGCITPVVITQANIEDVVIENASAVVLNFTLQFIDTAQRLAILQRIHDGMIAGGALILSEKICFPEPELQQLNTDLHHAFKKANGYSDLEISQKRTALENVLLPETLATHQQRIADAGFRTFDAWFQCFNFVSIVAIK